MRTQNICILATSIKNQGLCVAGIAVNRTPDGKWKSTGEWIRPISARTNGEINYQESHLKEQSRPIEPFDIIEIPLKEKADVAGQPEDWLIQPGNRWIYKDKVNSQRAVKALIQNPDDLWYQESEKIDRVTPEFVNERGLPSLYMISPDEIQLLIEEVDYGEGPKKRRRAVFKYNGKSYNFAMTDPNANRKYLAGFPDIPTGYVENFPKDILGLCVSLAPEWKGALASQAYHYKLAAAIIE